MDIQVKSTFKVEITGTPEELLERWELFEGVAGAKEAAVALTKATAACIETALAAGALGKLPSATEALMGKTLAEYSQYGANDTEGRSAVRGFARKVQMKLGVEPTYE